jgi:uncharacterized membrane protein
VTGIVLARVLHVLAVVVWIGGVSMVTTILLPSIRRSYPAPQRFPVFHALEERFARQARFTTVLAGASGFYMAWRLDARDRFRSAEFWWMHAMVLTWFVFTLMLFVIEPLFLERLLVRRAAGSHLSPDRMAAPVPAGTQPVDGRGRGGGQPRRDPVRLVRDPANLRPRRTAPSRRSAPPAPTSTSSRELTLKLLHEHPRRYLNANT